MAREAKPVPAALGFRVRSGWAMAVLLVGTADKPQLAICREILLSDPKIPQSKQPYHAALELPEKEGKLVTRELSGVVRQAAKQSVQVLLKDATALRYEVKDAGLVVGSVVDPATLHNEHIRAHGFEGQLFRTALEDALRARSIPCATYVEKKAYDEAVAILSKAAAELKRGISEIGEAHDGSWRAEEKLAALAAWSALARSGKQTRR